MNEIVNPVPRDERIINYTLENDFYAFTQGLAWQVASPEYPYIKGEFGLIDRGHTEYPPGFGRMLHEEVEKMADLELSDEEEVYLRSKVSHILSPPYIDWLKGFRFDPSKVNISQTGGKLDVLINDNLYKAVYWETPLLATISELYHLLSDEKPEPEEVWFERARQKGRDLKANDTKVAEFGLRRRYSSYVEQRVVEALIETAGRAEEGGVFVGTSNVHLARLLETKPIGTQAHQWYSAHAALFGFTAATEKALWTWQDIYKRKLGIALMDTFTTPVFLRAFDASLAQLYDGCRQDSWKPLVILDMLIDHYQSKRIQVDPLTKDFVPSDGLNVKKAIEIRRACEGRIQFSSGMGTSLSNDVGVTPLKIVIKLLSITRPDGIVVPTIKLTDSPGKHTGDPETIKRAKAELGIPQ